LPLKPHPAAEIFPPMSGADFQALVDDIRENGQREPIIVHDGLILDGRNRYRACIDLGLEPATMKWDRVGTPEAYVISTNLRRRHLNESQRAMIAKKLATLTHGQRKADASIEASSQDDAARMLNVSRSAVQRAAVVQQRATPELVEAVERGDIPVSTAAQLVHLPKARQREIAKNGKRAATKAAKQVRARKSSRVPAATPSLKETEHVRDLRFLRESWAATCESARAAFLNELGFKLQAVA
jgi:ParB-like chromosome segregation protein Spo0J